MADITLEMVDLDDGRCHAILTDADGQALLDRIYKNRNSANSSVRYRLQREGLEHASFTRIHPEESGADSEDGDEDEPDDDSPTPEPELSATPAPSSPTDRWLAKLRGEAQKALDEALRLRQRAEALELEHKRLTAAADVLEGPEA